MLPVPLSLLLASGLLSTCQAQLTALGAPRLTMPGSVPPEGQCTMSERRRAFDRCIQNFGFQHLNHFDFLANSAPACRAEVFRCQDYSIPCTYDDLMKRCKPHGITALKKISERTNRGRGSRNSIFQAVYRRIAPMITMMMYTGMGGGGLGGMFGF